MKSPASAAMSAPPAPAQESRSEAPLPFISIIVPMRNEAGHIAACLESLLAQDYPRHRLEILVVDGASDDGSRELVERVARVSPVVRLVRNPKRIIPAALNAGIRAARGHYILRADCKSRYARNYARTCVTLLSRPDVANVGGPCVTVPGAETPVARSIAAITTHPIVMGGSRYRSNMTDEEYADGAIYGAWERSLFDRIGYFNEGLERGEDNEFNSRILRAGGRILKSPRVVVHYLCRPTLGSFLRQTYANGLWHFLTLVANPGAFRFRYFAPAGWVCWLAGFGSLTALDEAFLMPLLAGLFIYGGAVLLVTADVLRAHGGQVAACVPLAMASFHLVYGWATLAGLVRFGLLDPTAIRRVREGGRAPDTEHVLASPDGPPF